MPTVIHRPFRIAAVVVWVLAALPVSTYASHSWNNYHWARTSNPFALQLGDNVSTAWDVYLANVSADWSTSAVLDTTIASGAAKPRTCKPTTGRVEVCSERYGNNGWLGIASIWVSGAHITKGSVKVNDTYFNTKKYNTAAWRNLVMCQEVGHTLGLDHQDETFDNPNLGTCMDYTNDPDGTIYDQANNEHPNQHDYDQLEEIYSHLDNTTTVGSLVSSGPGRGKLPPVFSDPDSDEAIQVGTAQWGKLIRSTNNGRTELYELDLGGGHKKLTRVIWADPDEPGAQREER